MSRIFQVAWGNTFQNIKRTAAALGGISFSILLVFFQIGFLEAMKTQSTSLFDFFDFDIALVSDKYQILPTAPTFDRRRMFQATVDPDIVDSFKLNVDSGRWTDPQTQVQSSALIIGIDDKPSFIRDENLREKVKKMQDGRSVLLDEYSHPDYGARQIGQIGLMGKLEVEVTELFQLGLFFYAEGSVLTNEGNFSRLAGRGSDQLTLGLLKIRPGADVDTVVRRVRGLLPPDVAIMSRQSLYEEEHAYFVDVKPVGAMSKAAVLVAFLVGLVILYQVLSTELNNRMHEYATMKAMGFGTMFVYGIGLTQNLLFILFSYIPAFVLSTIIFNTINSLIKFPTMMTFELAVIVLALSVVMATGAGALAMRKLQSADPVELF